MQRCPVCRARLRGAPICPRCEADLGRAQQAEQAARRRERQALEALLAGQPQTAAAALAQAKALHRRPMPALLAALIDPPRQTEQAAAASEDPNPAQAPSNTLPPIQPRHWWI